MVKRAESKATIAHEEAFAAKKRPHALNPLLFEDFTLLGLESYAACVVFAGQYFAYLAAEHHLNSCLLTVCLAPTQGSKQPINLLHAKKELAAERHQRVLLSQSFPLRFQVSNQDVLCRRVYL